MKLNQYHLVWLYILLAALALQLFFPWWSAALAAAAMGAAFSRKISHAFFAGFAGIGLLWLLVSGYIHFANDGILSGRVAAMMGLPGAFSIILVTALLGALIGGLSALSGFLLKDLFVPRVIETSEIS